MVAVMVSSAIDWQSFRLGFAPEITQGEAVAIAVLDAASIGVVAWLLLHVQKNLNEYWHHVSGGRLTDPRRGIGEVVFAVVGVLFWLGTLATLLSESFRVTL